MIKEKNNRIIAFDPRYQSKNTLVSVMKDAYLEQCMNPPDQFSDDLEIVKKTVNAEAARLNKIVLIIATDAMYENYVTDEHYKEDVTAGIQPISLPVNVSVKGTKGTRDISSVFFG